MTRIATVSCVLAFCIAMAAQSEPGPVGNERKNKNDVARLKRTAEKSHKG
jgi:hypothetical protein